jgi:hypothetical protein
MSYLFWSVFFSCVAYMIWRGFSDKRKHFRQLHLEHERQRRSAAQGNTPQTAHD